MNRATPAVRPDLTANRDQLSAEFYKAGMRYIRALDEWVESQAPASERDKEVTTARDRISILEVFLHRLYPDEFADTNSAAE